MSDTDESFVITGQQLAGILRRHGLRDDHRLLDIGCGYGRLAAGLATSGFGGTYVGFDILRKHIRWCRQNITPATAGQYQFRHVDVRNSRYNPSGVILAQETRFPARGGQFDFASMFSVFTHFYEADIRRYLEELRRVLRPGGIAVTTWFLFDAERLPAATDPERTRFPMDNMINAVTRYTLPADPLRAIAYDEDFAQAMIRDAGLEVMRIVRGSWCGGDTDPYFQDLIVVAKPRPVTKTGFALQVDRARRLTHPAEAARTSRAVARRVISAIRARRSR